MSLTPEYLSTDYSTLVEKMRDELQESDIFRDYKYEGSNISIILELMAYIGELTTFYTNKLASNSYFDTVDIFENAHRLSSWLGYHPKGHRSSNVDLTVTLDEDTPDLEVGDEVYVPAWKQVTSTETYDGVAIKFATTLSETFTVDELPYEFDIHVKQGTIYTYEFTGDDMIDNEILLNLVDYAYDDDLDDDYPSIAVYVNDEEWDRLDDFYDELSGLYDENDVFRFEYDKYQRYKIIFSEARNTPSTLDEIEVNVLETLGENGNVGAGTITSPETYFVFNKTKDDWIDNDYVDVTNEDPSTGGTAPETIEQIKSLAPRTLNTQFRNVTKEDYVAYLEKRTDVDAAYAYGEQEVAPSGSVEEFNKVYITVIPNDWTSETIETSATSGGFLVPISWSSDYENELSEYLELRKMLNAYEYYELPELVYFYYDIGLKLKRAYSYEDVVFDVKDKLEYYFETTNREFHETIYFTDIINFIVDETQVDTDNDFEQIKGIKNMIFRDIDSNFHIYEPNYSNNFPQYVEEDDTFEGKNKIRNITLGYNQFPMIMISLCNFREEL